MSEKGLFDWFDEAKTLELVAERAKQEQQLIDVDDELSKRLYLNTNYGKLGAADCTDEDIRKAPALSPEAQAWYDKLPAAGKPSLLRCRFPRVLEKLSARWTSPRGLKLLLDELLLDDRGGRAGFPLQALREMHALRDYYFEVLFPDHRDLLRTNKRF
jgi:hypothetical protein